MVYEIIRKYKCDIVGVQELTREMHEDLSNNLKEYTIVGEGRSKGIFNEKNDILVNKKHKVINFETFWLSNKPSKVGSSVWYSIYPRICTTALIELSNGKLVRIYNTHLDCGISKAKRYGLYKIMENVEKKIKEDVPVILMGDFNIKPNSKIIKEFQGNTYGNKRFTAVQEFNKELYGMSTMSKFNGKKNKYHIDYIFLSEEFNILNSEIIKYNKNGKYPSDHYPLLAEIELK